MCATEYSSNAPLLSVVVPVFNEKDNIRPLVGEIVSALDERVDYELIYVNDCSEDGTQAELDALQASTSIDLRVISHPSRRGQSAAIVSGIGAARGTWVATIDGDGQNNPADIPALLESVVDAHRDNPAVVCVAGIRVGRKDTWVKKISSRIANSVRQGILKDGIPDTGCGLKVFQRAAFQALPHFDHIHRFVPALFQFYGGAVISHPVSHRPRLRGDSKYGIGNRLWVGIVDLVGVCWLRRRAIHQPWQPL